MRPPYHLVQKIARARAESLLQSGDDRVAGHIVRVAANHGGGARPPVDLDHAT